MKHLALAVLLAGCASSDMTLLSEFQPTVDGRFAYTASADVMNPDGDPRAEEARIARLEQYLQDHRLCPSGYTLTSRTAILQRKGLLADVKDVYYQGQCVSYD